jgi:ubiquinone biosynthesis protein
MKTISLLWIGLPSAAFRRAASSSLSECCSPAIAEQVWSRTLNRQRDLKSRRPRGWSLGIQLQLRYIEWYVALYQASLEHGLSREQAGGMVEEIAWSINKPLVAAMFSLSRLRSSELRIRIRWMYDVMFMLFFTAPFRRRVLASNSGVAFDMIACPAATYCRDMGVPELTPHAACSFDARLAREFGVPFYKTQSIAGGAPLCDIRFFTQSTNQP